MSSFVPTLRCGQATAQVRHLHLISPALCVCRVESTDYADLTELSSIATATATDADDALAVQRSLAEVWSSLGPNVTPAKVLPTIQDVVETCQTLGQEKAGPPLQVMVTGSLHLVGGVLSVVDGQAGQQ